MGYTYYEYIIPLAADSDASLAGLKEKLDKSYAKESRPYSIRMGEGFICLKVDHWTMEIGWSEEAHVLEESRELSEIAEYVDKNSDAYQALQGAHRRFETSASPDPNMDYFNDSLYVLEAIESFSGVFVFDPHQGFINL